LYKKKEDYYFWQNPILYEKLHQSFHTPFIFIFVFYFQIICPGWANNVCTGAFNIAPVTGACPATTYSLQTANVTAGLGSR
jgi:hypothetical protein